MSAAARASPSGHGSTSVTATASPASRPRSTIASRFRGGLLDRALLRDVVDPALDDEDVGAVEDEVEPARDLIRPLAVDRGRPELEARVGLRRPPLPLAPLVGSRDARANGGIRIPERRAGRDRVADDRDRDPGHVQPGNSLLLRGASSTTRSQSSASAMRSSVSIRGGRPPRSRRAMADCVVPQSSARSRWESPIALRRSATRSAIWAKNQPGRARDPLVEPLDRPLCLRARSRRHVRSIAICYAEASGAGRTESPTRTRPGTTTSQ